jgi:hypothetical protein
MLGPSDAAPSLTTFGQMTLHGQATETRPITGAPPSFRIWTGLQAISLALALSTTLLGQMVLRAPWLVETREQKAPT